MVSDTAGKRPPRGGGIELAGRTVAAGSASAELVAHLLGLDQPGSSSEVVAVAWVMHRAEATLRTADGIEATFCLERRDSESKGLVQTEELCLYFRGDDLPVEVTAPILDSAPERLEGWTIEALAERIAADPGLGTPGLHMPAGADEGPRPRSLLDTWGDTDAFADFFAAGELARAQLDSLDPSRLFAFVQHSDAECVHVNPHSPARIAWLVNYPWEGRRGYVGHRVQGHGVHSGSQLITTDLDENDVIMGNPDKLDRVLEHAVAEHEKHGKTVFFSNTCVPVVVGEDVESKVSRCRAESACPMLYLTVTPSSMVNVFDEILVERRLEAEKTTAPADDPRINLIGFPRTTAVNEIIDALETLGVRVNAVLLPDLTHELIDRMPRARLNVFAPNTLWQHLYDQLLLSSRIPSITPPAPFGWAGTRRWFEEVARALDLEEDFERSWRDMVAAHTRQLSDIATEASRHRLGLVVRAGELHSLTQPSSTWGVPLLEVLEELGFRLEVLLKAESRRQAAEAAQQLLEKLRRPRAHKVGAFRTFDTMMSKLGESEAAAFFSSHFFDWRLSSSGRSAFSLQHFEPGLKGAIRTGGRLLDLCRSPFFSRYSAFLQRSRHGHRLHAESQASGPPGRR